MDFGLSEEQVELQGLARRILADRTTPARLKEIDASADWFDRETWAELAKANLLGVALSEEHGGLGMGFLDACLVLVEVGRHVAPLPAVPCLVSGAMAVAAFGSPGATDVLRRVAAGDAILTAAGCDRTRVVKATVFLTDLSLFAALNETYARFFGDHRPARAVVEVSALPRGARIEMEAVALR